MEIDLAPLRRHLGFIRQRGEKMENGKVGFEFRSFGLFFLLRDYLTPLEHGGSAGCEKARSDTTTLFPLSKRPEPGSVTDPNPERSPDTWNTWYHWKWVLILETSAPNAPGSSVETQRGCLV